MNVFDLQAKIGINTTEYKKGLSEASREFSEFGGKIKDGVAKLAKISTAAVGAAAAGIGAIVKQSVSAYADYEQLVGGIETLFGDSARKVLENANKAFAEKIKNLKDSLTEERLSSTKVYRAAYKNSKAVLLNTGYVTIEGGISPFIGLAAGLVAGFLVSSLICCSLFISKEDDEKK